MQTDILLAEDDFEDVQILDMALKSLELSYTLRHAANGDVLFILLKDRIPAILFLDIHMPCKDGAACIIEIRKNKEYDKLPIVMYTSNFSKRILDECFKNGANLYMKKANTYSELIEKLKVVFSIDWDHYLDNPEKDNFVLK